MGPDPDFAVAIRPLMVRPHEKWVFSLERSGAKASNAMFSFGKKSHESMTVCRKIAISAHFGGPPQRSPESQGARVLGSRN